MGPEVPSPQKEYGTRDTLPLWRSMAPEIPYPTPPPPTTGEQIDRHLWKHYLPATTVAGGKNQQFVVRQILSLKAETRDRFVTHADVPRGLTLLATK